MSNHKNSRPYTISATEAKNLTDDGFVVCPYCNRKMKALSCHILNIHKKSKKEVYYEHPGTLYLAPSVNKKLTEGKNKWLENPENYKKVQETSRTQMTKQWESNELFINNSIEASKSRIVEFNKDSEFRKKSGYHMHKKVPYIHDEQEIFFRSNWELKVAQYLDSRNIKWTYESEIIDLNNGCNYYPDFYLPDFNLILEVHPKRLINDWMRLKQKASIDAGYNFIFITENELYNLNDINFNVI